jgi:hypothetical protein
VNQTAKRRVTRISASPGDLGKRQVAAAQECEGIPVTNVADIVAERPLHILGKQLGQSRARYIEDLAKRSYAEIRVVIMRPHIIHAPFEQRPLRPAAPPQAAEDLQDEPRKFTDHLRFGAVDILRNLPEQPGRTRNGTQIARETIGKQKRLRQRPVEAEPATAPRPGNAPPQMILSGKPDEHVVLPNLKCLSVIDDLSDSAAPPAELHKCVAHT